MERKETKFSYVYENLKDRITSGQLPPGSKLPSYRKLSEEYHVGLHTIIHVVDALKQNGLVDVQPRHAPVVLTQNQALAPNAAVLSILEQRNNILQLYQTFTLLMPALLAFASQDCSLETLPHYKQAVKIDRLDGEADVWQVTTALDKDILKSCGNPLLVDLYSVFELRGHLSFFTKQCPFFRNTFLQKQPSMPDNLMAILQGNDPIQKYRDLRQIYCFLYESVVETIKYLEGSTLECPEPTAVDFRWNPMRGKNYYYTNIVCDLITKIRTGVYPTGSLLLEGQLAKEYGVSVSTIRKALALLQHKGHTKTLNAKGTVVLSLDDINNSLALTDFTTKQQAMVYLYSMQLMVLLAQPIAACVVPHFTKEDLGALNAKLQKQNAILLSELYHAVVEHLQIEPLRAFLIETNRISQWGFYFSFYPQSREMVVQINQFSFEAYRHLCDRDAVAFGESWADCCRCILDSVRSCMVEKYKLYEALSVRTPESFLKPR